MLMRNAKGSLSANQSNQLGTTNYVLRQISKYMIYTVLTINNANKKQRITMELYRLDRGESEAGRESIANPRQGEHGESGL